MKSATTSSTFVQAMPTLRERVEFQCKVYDVLSECPDQAGTIELMRTDAIQGHLKQRKAMLAIQEHERANALELARQNARKIALEQAKNNLATANYIGKSCCKLGGALKRIAMQDINSLRSLKNTARVASIMGEYTNFGTFWNA